jgi:hypothetical protein
MVLDEPVTDRYQIAIPTGTTLRLPSQTDARGQSERQVERNTAMAYQSVQTIDDLLADSLIQKIMLADHVEPQALKLLLDGTARHLAASRRAASVQVGQDLGRRGPFRQPPLLTRPTPRAAGGECGASLCG